jgi:hypothetical protein
LGREEEVEAAGLEEDLDTAGLEDRRMRTRRRRGMRRVQGCTTKGWG